MALTQTDLDVLVKSYSSGKLSTSYEGRAVTYRSLAELRDVIADVAAMIGVPNPLVSTAKNAPRRIYQRFNSGT